MYYYIELSDIHVGTKDAHGTNTLRYNDLTSGKTRLTWKLNDTPTTKKFVEITQSAITSQYRTIDWNLYTTDIDTDNSVL